MSFHLVAPAPAMCIPEPSPPLPITSWESSGQKEFEMLQHCLHQIQFWLHPHLHQQHSSSSSGYSSKHPSSNGGIVSPGIVEAQAALTGPLLDTVVVADPPFHLQRRVLSFDSSSPCRLPRSSQIPAFDPVAGGNVLSALSWDLAPAPLHWAQLISSLWTTPGSQRLLASQRLL